MSWKPSEFLSATSFGIAPKAGYVFRGLGLYMAIKASPKGRRPPLWCLVHLGSGHAICYISGTVADAFPIATEFAECGDWSFDGLDGWKNLDPEIKDKAFALYQRHKPHTQIKPGGSDAERARQVAMARSN